MNNKDFKIAVYYIATGKYKVLFPEFLESVHNFYPDNKKIVKVISDGLEEYSDYEKGNDDAGYRSRYVCCRFMLLQQFKED